MRPQTIGFYQSRRTTRPVAESYQPQSEWKEDGGATILIVHLPDFLKEQVGVTIDESLNSVRVYGERVLRDNRRIRVNEKFSIPENCDMNAISHEFKVGVLTITMPRINTEIGKASPTNGIDKGDEKDVEVMSHQKPATFDIVEIENKTEVDTFGLLKGGRKRDTQKDRVEISRESSLIIEKTEMDYQREGKRDHESTQKVVGEKKEELEKVNESTEKGLRKEKGSEISEESKEKEIAFLESLENGKEKTEKCGDEDMHLEKGKEKDVGEEDETELGLDDAFADKSMEDLTDKRNLLVNMSAAAIVILVLGGQIFNT